MEAAHFVSLRQVSHMQRFSQRRASPVCFVDVYNLPRDLNELPSIVNAAFDLKNLLQRRRLLFRMHAIAVNRRISFHDPSQSPTIRFEEASSNHEVSSSVSTSSSSESSSTSSSVVRYRILRGPDTFRAMYRAAGLGLIARFTELPVISHLADRAYEWFARNRHQFIGRVGGAPPCELCVKEDPDAVATDTTVANTPNTNDPKKRQL